ncbi:MAG: wax ester/triacylglycerol synthase domain-containing protein [Sciscionella sp.]
MIGSLIGEWETSLMRHLDPLDANYLHLEGRTAVAQLGSLAVLEATGTLTLGDLRSVLEQRLHLARELQERLLAAPFRLGYYWVDDPDFDIEFHLREVALPTPGDDRQLGEQVARIHARPLDRTRPLWEIYLVHNLTGGRQALYGKVHRAAAAGLGPLGPLAILMTQSADDPVPEGAAIEPVSRLPGGPELLFRGLADAVAQPVAAARLATEVPQLRELARSRPSVPASPLNRVLTSHRRVAFGSVASAVVERPASRLGVRRADVIRAAVAGALREWLLDHDALPDAPLVIAEPVPVGRSAARDLGPDEDGDPSSVVPLLVPLPTQLATPRARVLAAAESARAAGDAPDAGTARLLGDAAAALPAPLAEVASRAALALATRGEAFSNLTLTIADGPATPRFVAGRLVTGRYPLPSVGSATGALAISAATYGDRLYLGLVSCRELVPDLERIAGYLQTAFDELARLLAPRTPADPAKRPGRPRRGSSHAPSPGGRRVP